MKRAVIVGSGGQDGRLLYQFLVSKNYHIVGLKRDAVDTNCGFESKAVNIFQMDDVYQFIQEFRPDEIYYLAAFHHNSEEKTGGTRELYLKSHDTHVLGLIHFLEAIVQLRPQCKLFYAASSMIFGNPPTEVQDENTPFNPTTVYGMTKLSGLLTCRYYRSAHQTFASVGILYNHESKYRGPHFLSKKTVLGALDIRLGRQNTLKVGDLSAVVDWGSASDYVEAMQLILQCDRSDEFIVASGQRRSVQEFVKTTFELLGMDWTQYVREDSSLLNRKKAVLIGNSQKLKQVTGWSPKTSFSEMIQQMILAEGVKLERS